MLCGQNNYKGCFMKSRLIFAAIGVAGLIAGSVAGAAEDMTVPYRQDTPPQPKPISQKQRDANVKLVFSYYRRGKDWSDETLSKIIAPDFIQHDVCEPSGRQAYGQLFRDVFANGAGFAPDPNSKGWKDSAGQGFIRSIVADGDLVVVIRDMSRRWENGPVPWMKTTFVDIWRVQNGKITEQWASVVPGDGFSKPSTGNCKDYHDDPPPRP
jgi:predicted SnoaL-like aldol condensation-catalyzing enzyme